MEGAEVILENLDHNQADNIGIKPSEAWEFREEVRAKYNLPECGYRWEDPQRYIQTMEDFLRKNNVDIREKHEFSRFFKDNPGADALASGPNVFRDTTVVVQNASDGDWYRLRARANQLAHEAVHALQNKNYPRMPDEVAEREAYYYQKLYPQRIMQYKDDPESFRLMLQGIEKDIKSSVNANFKINEIPDEQKQARDRLKELSGVPSDSVYKK